MDFNDFECLLLYSIAASGLAGPYRDGLSNCCRSWRVMSAIMAYGWYKSTMGRRVTLRFGFSPGLKATRTHVHASILLRLSVCSYLNLLSPSSSRKRIYTTPHGVILYCTLDFKVDSPNDCCVGVGYRTYS